MKNVFLSTVILLFTSLSTASIVNYNYNAPISAPNMEILADHPECSKYLSGGIPTFVQAGMDRLIHEFNLKPNTNAIIADFTCNMNHLFTYEINGKTIIHNIKMSYRASGGRGAVNNVKRTGGTPPGVHEIYKKQGESEGWPLNYAIDGSKYGFKNHSVVPTSDLTFWGPKFVMTRILRLRGLEGEVNNNSRARSILIHGTPEEGLLGYHESGGCIRMNNVEVIELYNQMEVGSLVNVVYGERKYTINMEPRRYMEKSVYKEHGLICYDKEKCKKY